MLTPRGGLRIAIVNDVLYAIGGFNTDGDNILAVNEQYTPAGYIPEFPTWAPILLVLCVVTVVLVVYKQKLCKTQSLESEK